MKRKALVSLIALAAVATSSVASAQDARGIAEKGNFFVSADRLMPFFSFSRISETATANNTTVTTVSTSTSMSLLSSFTTANNVHTFPRLAFDYTVIPHLTVGGSLVLGFGLGGSESAKTETGGTTTETSRDSPTATLFGIAPRVGYLLPINDFIAIWPRGGFAFYSLTIRRETANGNPPVNRTTSDTDTAFSLDLDPQIVIAPIEHFFFSAGPLVNIPITGARSTEVTTAGTTNSTSNDLAYFQFGLNASLGGWFSL